jgi:hypothetical protein
MNSTTEATVGRVRLEEMTDDKFDPSSNGATSFPDKAKA